MELVKIIELKIRVNVICGSTYSEVVNVFVKVNLRFIGLSIRNYCSTSSRNTTKDAVRAIGIPEADVDRYSLIMTCELALQEQKLKL